MEAALIIIGIVAFVGILIGLSWYFDRKRSQAMEVVARNLNFAFNREGEAGVLMDWGHFHLFSHGHSRKVRNLLGGRANEIGVKIFDYRCTTGSGKNSHTWSQTVILFGSDKLDLPAFTLRPENLFHKIGGLFGCQDIDFPSHPGFSKRYLLRGRDEGLIRSVFTPEVLSFFENSSGLNAEGAQHHLLFYRMNKAINPDEIQALLAEGFRLFGLLKKV